MICDLYTKIGGSYEDAKSRLMTDKLIEKFVMKFPADPSFAQLRDAIAAEDIDAAFTAAHTLKGVALNLAFSELGKLGSDLTDTMRENARGKYSWAEYRQMFMGVEEAYHKVISAIAEYQK